MQIPEGRLLSSALSPFQSFPVVEDFTYIEPQRGLQMSWICEICKGSEPAKSVSTCGGLENVPSFDVKRSR